MRIVAQPRAESKEASYRCEKHPERNEVESKDATKQSPNRRLEIASLRSQ